MAKGWRPHVFLLFLTLCISQPLPLSYPCWVPLVSSLFTNSLRTLDMQTSSLYFTTVYLPWHSLSSISKRSNSLKTISILGVRIRTRICSRWHLHLETTPEQSSDQIRIGWQGDLQIDYLWKSWNCPCSCSLVIRPAITICSNLDYTFWISFNFFWDLVFGIFLTLKKIC